MDRTADGLVCGGADNQFTRRVDQFDFAFLIHNGNAIERIVDDALHHRAPVHRIEPLLEKGKGLGVDCPPQADGIGQ